MATVGLPLTGAGDATALVATDNIGGEHYQRMKIHDGLDGSTRPLRVLATTPGAADEGMVVRPIGSTAFNQAVVGTLGLTSGSSAVELTSVGSTRLAARFTVDNPTTAVSLSSQLTVTASGTTKVDVSSGVILGAGSSANIVGSVVNTSGSTAAIIGAVVVASGSTAFLMGAVAVSSGVVLGAGSSANILGSVTITSGSTAAILGAMVLASGSTAFIAAAVSVTSGVVLGAGSSANILGSVTITSGSTAAIVGAVVVASGSTAFLIGAVAVSSGVVLGAGSSANVLGSVTLAAGASANLVGSVGTFQGANLATSGSRIATSVDVSLLASGTSRVGCYIFNETTGSLLYIGLSTGIVSSVAYSYQIPAGAGQFFGGGGMPNYVGAIRGRLQSTTLAGIAVVGSFTT